MIPVNTSFPPFNPAVSVDDVQSQTANIVLIPVVVFMFVVMTYNFHLRSMKNMIWNEYRREYKPKEKDEIHPLFYNDQWYWFSYWINPLLSLFVLLGLTCWTWAMYGYQSHYYIQTPRDDFAVLITVCYGTMLVVYYVLIIVDIVWKSMSARKLHMMKDKRDSEEYRKAYAQMKTLTTLHDVGYMGMNGTTYMDIRKVIFWVNTVIWGNTPTAFAMLGVTWDRSPDNYPNSFIYDQQAGFVGTTGILLTIIWLIHSLYVSFEVMNYYADNDIGYDTEMEEQYKTKKNLRRTQVGLVVDTMGTRIPFKGSIPYQTCPWHYIIARVFFTYSIAFLIHNDQVKATAVFVGCGLLPLLLTLIANDNMYFITYEVTCYFYFHIISYFNQSVIWYRDTQEDINFNLITLNQSAACPGHCPSDEYGTSIATIYGFGFFFTLVSLIRILFFTQPLKDPKPKTM